MEAEDFSFKMHVLAGYSLRNSCRRRQSVQVSKLFMVNIYPVYCAVKLVVFKKGLVICDIFKETVLYLK